jgi:hypothetical protein
MLVGGRLGGTATSMSIAVVAQCIRSVVPVCVTCGNENSSTSSPCVIARGGTLKVSTYSESFGSWVWKRRGLAVQRDRPLGLLGMNQMEYFPATS